MSKILATFLLFISGAFANHLTIYPSGKQFRPVGKNLFISCKANVQNPELIRDLKWLGPDGQPVPEGDKIYTEELPGDPAKALFIKHLREEYSGKYTCSAVYANNEKLTAEAEITTYIGITWDDAPLEQYGIINTDYKIRCVVRANPPATVDWLKESLILSTGNRYVIESDGLLIKDISREDAGTYTCRAKVFETGSLEERDIKLEVQVKPEWLTRPGPVKGIENEKAEFDCQASGTPRPHYTWVDWEGNDATDKDGWAIKKDTGHLIAYQLHRRDAGEYRCIAENSAGRIESSTFLNVIIKPKVQELYNKTFVDNDPEGKIVCKASGDPMPDIFWRKWSSNEPFIPGGQPQDDRIVVHNFIERAPDYTEGEDKWRVSELVISGVRRRDDGLYECQARNEGGQYFRSGHIQVEFAPTFEEQPMEKQWSWDQNPVNLTCIATAIKNATISWWIRDREIGREIIDRNYKIFSNGARSDLIVTPLTRQYYGRYTCKAFNNHGTASFEIPLKEAEEPSLIQQVVHDKVTATTLQFRFVAPVNTGGLPLDSYAVEYKEKSMEWKNADRRVWPINPSGYYILENLHPTTTYHFRFASKNLVGFSEWMNGIPVIMPQRGPPEPPVIMGMHLLLSENYSGPSETDVSPNTIFNLSSPNFFEIGWYIPEDNGDPLDYFEVSYYPIRVTYHTPESSKRTSYSLPTIGPRMGDLYRTEVPHPGNVRYELKDLYPNTHYTVELRAHNSFGFSPSSFIIIKTAKGTNESLPDPGFYDRTSDESETPLWQIVLLVVGFLLLILLCLIILDFTLCKTRKKGLIFKLSRRLKKSRKYEGITSERKQLNPTRTSGRTNNASASHRQVSRTQSRPQNGTEEAPEIISHYVQLRPKGLTSSKVSPSHHYSMPALDISSDEDKDYETPISLRQKCRMYESAWMLNEASQKQGISRKDSKQTIVITLNMSGKKTLPKRGSKRDSMDLKSLTQSSRRLAHASNQDLIYANL